MRRRLRLLAACAALLALASCSVARTVPRRDLTSRAPGAAARSARLAAPGGQRVYGYTTTDGRFHPLPGRARLVGDTAVFSRPEGTAGWPAVRESAVTERVALSDLESVRVEAVGTLPTVLFVLALLGAGTLYVFGLFLSGLGS